MVREACPLTSARRLARVAGGEERREAASDRRNDEDRPRLERDVHHLPRRRDRVLERGRDSQELYEGEEDRVAEAVDIAALLPVLEDKDQDRAHGCDRDGQAERDQETSEKAPMPLFDREKSTELFADHQASLAATADG